MKRILLILISMCALSACSHDNKTKTTTMTISPHRIANTLYYSGVVQPMKTLVITCPADGVIVDMPFQYGDSISAGQQLFLISSAKFLTDYKNSLMQYVKAKNEFNTNEAQLNEGKFLHKNELISDDDFKMRQSNYYGSQLGLIQAQDSLEDLIKQLKLKDIDLYKLTIADVDKINKAMHLQSNSQDLQIIAPASGMILSPMKSEEENKKVLKGDAVKQGDVLATIGDMTGISVRIKVNELVVNQLKPGQKVKVTGIAFPDYKLEGKIASVDRQGEGSNNGLPSFMVQVVVPKLTKQQQAEINVGMSAKVEIDVSEDPQITVPINAVKEKNGDNYVEVIDANKRMREVMVKTGKTTIDSVTILSGLHEGDEIVLPG